MGLNPSTDYRLLSREISSEVYLKYYLAAEFACKHVYYLSRVDSIVVQ